MARQVIEHRGDRPGKGWHRHGWTVRTLTIRLGGWLHQVLVRKQRWLHVASGRTLHDRPPWELAWSRSSIEVVFLVVAAWLLSDRGLHQAAWPWADDRPSLRTAQRWLDRLRRDAVRWQVAIRQAVLDRLAPRPLEEILPTGGIPPPEGRRRSQWSAEDLQIRSGCWLLERAAHLLGIPVHSLLVEARRRQTPPMPMPS